MANYSFFDIDPNKTITISGITSRYPEIKPKGGTSYIDVTRMAWRNNKTSTVDEVPSVILTEYTLSYGIWTQNLFRFTGRAAAIAEQNPDPYGALYYGQETGFIYNIPYLVKPGDSLRGAIKNSWKNQDDFSKSFFRKAASKIKTVGGVVGGVAAPGFGTEDINAFAGTNAKSINISFPLYNTLDIQSTIDNFSFISLFGLQNLKTRTSYLTFIPPKIYKVDGVGFGNIYMPAAYVSSYDVQSIGTTRRIDELNQLGGAFQSAGQYTGGSGGALVPEAYKVTITLTELIAESANIMASSLGEEKVNVFKAVPTSEPVD
jgi:hypothetical protein